MAKSGVRILRTFRESRLASTDDFADRQRTKWGGILRHYIAVRTESRVGTHVFEQNVERVRTASCRAAEMVSNFARCTRVKKSSLPLGSEPRFRTEHLREHKWKKDLGPMKARKMGQAIQRVEELQRSFSVSSTKQKNQQNLTHKSFSNNEVCFSLR